MSIAVSIVALVAEERLELVAEVVGRRDGRLGAPVEFGLEHRDIQAELLVTGHDLVVDVTPAVDLVADSSASAGTSSTWLRWWASAAVASGCSAFVR